MSMAKSDTVHKCEVMDFFTWESEKTHKYSRFMHKQACFTSKLGSGITLQFCFPDVINTQYYIRPPQKHAPGVTDLLRLRKVLQKLQKGALLFVSFAGFKETLRMQNMLTP